MTHTRETLHLDAVSRHDYIKRVVTSNAGYAIGIALIVVAVVAVLAWEGVRQAQTMLPPRIISTAQPTPVTPLRMTLAETIIVYDAPNGAVIGPMPSGRTYDVIATDGVWTQIFGDDTTRAVWARTNDLHGVAPEYEQIVDVPSPTAVPTMQPTAVPPVQPVVAPVLPVVREVPTAVPAPQPAPVEYPNDVEDVPPLTTAEEAVLQQQLILGALGGATAQEVQP